MIFISYNLGKLLLAMSKMEGWTEPNQKNGWRGSRAYRNNNPGNLRRSIFECGNHENYSIFKNSFIGWNAFQWDIMQKCKGNTVTGLKGDSTIRDLLTVWAPPSDNNNTEKYIEFICKETGLSENFKIGDLLTD